jgi:hypothetical protein
VDRRACRLDPGPPVRCVRDLPAQPVEIAHYVGHGGVSAGIPGWNSPLKVVHQLG